MNVMEKLCLQWNDFKENATSSFRELREDKDLTDVTLVCEDGKQVEAHKIILAASSPFFMEILKRNKHSHPLIYMRGLQSETLLSIVDFLYLGEANVFQDNLESFLALAEELKLKGLNGTDQQPVGNAEEKADKVVNAPVNFREGKQILVNGPGQASTMKPDAISNNPIIADPNDLDQQIKSMMTLANVLSNDGRNRLAICNICGKDGPANNMPNHIEANHITGISHSCNICGKTSRSRNALKMHKHNYHKALLYDVVRPSKA